ncbi:MAG: hypothetical protein GY867_09980 [bacterium]|nr:hypothetical protein [bacterium]
MRSRGTGMLPARLESARRRFEHWRLSREHRSRIPDPLWNSAVKLSATYGIHRTAKTLRLNPDSLKKRVASTNGDGALGQRSPRQKTAGQEAATAFVELVSTEGACPPECIVELEHPCGAKMRIHAKGNPIPDVVTAVSQVFFGAMP